MTVDLAGTCTGPGPCDTTPLGTGDNWLKKVQGLPLYIRAVAHSLRRSGMDESRAVATAIATVKRWAAGGGGVTGATRARAVKAVAEWEAKKAASHALTAAAAVTVDLAPSTPHVYHWRHGWIPITPEAALSKSHSSHAGAARILGANGQHDEAQRMLARGLASAKVGSPTRTRYRNALAGHMQRHGTLIGPNPSARPGIRGIHIEHTGDGTLVHGTSRGDGTASVLKQHGFRWSSNLGAWYLPRNQQFSTRSMKVTSAERDLRAAGHDVTVTREAERTTTAAEREAMQQASSTVRAERLTERAARKTAEANARHDAARQIMDRIPMGQPILIGHHSERGHRADMKRIDSHITKSLEARSEADSAERRAAAARQNARPEGPLARQRRIDRNEADLRRIDRTLQQHAIAVKAPTAAARVGVHPLGDSHLQQLHAARADLVDQIAHDKAQIEASGHKAVAAGDIKPGDVIHYRGRTHVVKKVNKTTVSVPTGYSWDDKVPINQITKVTKQADLAVTVADTNDLPALTMPVGARLRIDASSPTAVTRATRAVITDGHTLLHGSGMVAAARNITKRVKAAGHGVRVRRVHVAGKQHLHIQRTTR